MRTWLKLSLSALSLIGVLAAVGVSRPFITAYASPPPTFSLTPLLLTNGGSEPEISIGPDGTMAIVSLQWVFDLATFGTRLWTGSFGSAPVLLGEVDGGLQHPGKSILGGADADVDLGSTGRMHVTSLTILFNPTFNRAQLGVSRRSRVPTRRPARSRSRSATRRSSTRPRPTGHGSPPTGRMSTSRITMRAVHRSFMSSARMTTGSRGVVSPTRLLDRATRRPTRRTITFTATSKPIRTRTTYTRYTLPARPVC